MRYWIRSAALLLATAAAIHGQAAPAAPRVTMRSGKAVAGAATRLAIEINSAVKGLASGDLTLSVAGALPADAPALPLPPAADVKAGPLLKGGTVTAATNADGSLAIHLAPAIPVDGAGILLHVPFTPPADAAPGTVYTIHLAGSLQDGTGQSLQAAWRDGSLVVITPVKLSGVASAAKVKARAGDTAKVEIRVSKAVRGITGGAFTLTFASSTPAGAPALALDAAGPAVGALLPGAQIAVGTSAADAITFQISGTQAADGPGIVAIVPLQVPADATPGTIYSLELNAVFDVGGRQAVPSIDGGMLTVVAPKKSSRKTGTGTTGTPPPSSIPVPGDVNGDGKVTVADVSLALRIAIGLLDATAAQLQAGDLNGDGKIDVSDAVQILRLVVESPAAG